MGVMKIWNIVPRAGLEPTSLVFQVSVLQLHPDVTAIPTPTCLMQLLASEVNADYYNSDQKQNSEWVHQYLSYI